MSPENFLKSIILFISENFRDFEVFRKIKGSEKLQNQQH